MSLSFVLNSNSFDFLVIVLVLEGDGRKRKRRRKQKEKWENHKGYIQMLLEFQHILSRHSDASVTWLYGCTSMHQHAPYLFF